MPSRTGPGRGKPPRPSTRPPVTLGGRKLTIAWIVADLGISQRTFYRWKKEGTAPETFALPGGGLRVHESVYLAWLEERIQKGAK